MLDLWKWLGLSGRGWLLMCLECEVVAALAVPRDEAEKFLLLAEEGVQ
jgi:hypothetical protein